MSASIFKRLKVMLRVGDLVVQTKHFVSLGDDDFIGFQDLVLSLNLKTFVLKSSIQRFHVKPVGSRSKVL